MKQRTDKQILQEVISRAFDEVFGEYLKELDETIARKEEDALLDKELERQTQRHNEAKVNWEPLEELGKALEDHARRSLS